MGGGTESQIWDLDPKYIYEMSIIIIIIITLSWTVLGICTCLTNIGRINSAKSADTEGYIK